MHREVRGPSVAALDELKPEALSLAAATMPPATAKRVSCREEKAVSESCRSVPNAPAGSFRLDAGELDHFRPFLDFIGNELAEVVGRSPNRRGTKIGEACFDRGFGKCRPDFLIELLNDLSGRALWCAKPVPEAHLVTRHELANGRN